AIPAELETIVTKALAKAPEERYTTAQELADDLQRFLNQEPIRARRPSWLHRVQKWKRRHRAVVWVANGSGAVLLLCAVVVLAMNRPMIAQEQQQTKIALAAETDALQRERESFYRYRLTVARHNWLTGDLEQARRHLLACPPELRDQDWRHLDRLC